jgi:hypothetical protein
MQICLAICLLMDSMPFAAIENPIRQQTIMWVVETGSPKWVASMSVIMAQKREEHKPSMSISGSSE